MFFVGVVVAVGFVFCFFCFLLRIRRWFVPSVPELVLFLAFFPGKPPRNTQLVFIESHWITELTSRWLVFFVFFVSFSINDFYLIIFTFVKRIRLKTLVSFKNSSRPCGPRSLPCWLDRESYPLSYIFFSFFLFSLHQCHPFLNSKPLVLSVASPSAGFWRLRTEKHWSEWEFCERSELAAHDENPFWWVLGFGSRKYGGWSPLAVHHFNWHQRSSAFLAMATFGDW